MADYTRGALRRRDLAASWHEQLRGWLATAAAAPQVSEAAAMVLASASADGEPSARTVLLKGLDERGLVFFTNLGSRKALELVANPRASAVFSWVGLERQVVVCGSVAALPRDDVERYARSRPRGSQLSAWASAQSGVVTDRAALEAARAEVAARYPVDVPVPPFWGGFRLAPVTVEFWQGRADRLHDRLRFRRDEAGWTVERLFP